MHHTTRAFRPMPGRVLLALLLAAIPPTAVGAGPPPVPPPAAAPAKGALLLPINGTQRLQHSSKKKLLRAVNEKDTVARVAPMPNDPASVLITGLDPGITKVILTDEDGKEEAYEVVVQFDVEYLRSVLKRAVPTAHINPIPAANNTVILTGTVQRSEDIDIALRTAQSVVLGPDRVINALQVPGVMQVQLCCVVAQVSRDEFRRMAFSFLAGENQWFFGSTVGQAVANPSLVGVGSQFLNVNATLAGIPGTPNGAPTNLILGVLNSQSGFLTFLEALRDESIVKLLAEPRLVTISGRQASFLSGGEQAIPVPAGLGQIGVQFEEFGTRLSFVPIVLGNGRIRLEVEPEVSDLNPAFGTTIQGTVVPGRTTQRVHTSVELEDGQTFMIGGLIQNTVRGNTQKVPVLGDIPFLGAAFSSKSFEERETELVILVTPHLVDPMDCNQAPKVLPGMETRNPDDFELFLEGILEAPRGPRQVCPDGRYLPAYRNGPSAALMPCGGACGPAGCAAVPAPVAPAPAGLSPAPEAAPAPIPGSGSLPQAPAGEAPGSAAPAEQPADGKPTQLPGGSQ